jgi:hypothetical protein
VKSPESVNSLSTTPVVWFSDTDSAYHDESVESSDASGELMNIDNDAL